MPLYVVGEESDGESERAQKKAEKEEREEKNRFVSDCFLFYKTFTKEMERKEGKGGKG